MIAVAAICIALASAQSIDLFNGKDLSGWVNVNCEASTWTVHPGDPSDPTPFILCSGVPTGVLRTAQMYENFTLDLDWMHQEEPGNAGLFIWSDGLPAKGVPFTRSVEVQIMLTPDVSNEQGQLLYTGQGDIFPIHGAVMTPARPHPAGWSRCLPSARMTKGKGQWNHYRVTANQGSITLAVNGTEVSSGTNITPRKGFICLESEGTPIRFRNIRLTPLPDSKPSIAAGQCARADEGFTSLLTAGLPQWQDSPENQGHWTLEEGVLSYDGKGGDLWSKASFANFELIADWKWVGESQGKFTRPQLGPDGRDAKDASGATITAEIDEWDSGIFLRGNSKSQINIWNWPVGSGEVWGYRTDESMTAEVRAACTPRVRADAPIGSWNRFRIEMDGETLAVELNNQSVIGRALLPGVPASGTLALQTHGSAIAFTNIFIRPIEVNRPNK
ncbi:MAG: DUF1080 domain-containing protein [Phycisphaerales bacterium]|nr:DUF1080 domain-containing protein [Phycisphaerales bacterium]